MCREIVAVVNTIRNKCTVGRIHTFSSRMFKQVMHLDPRGFEDLNFMAHFLILNVLPPHELFEWSTL
jgi:hypothetical protein